MSIYIGHGKDAPAFLCSNRGWNDVCRWIDSLPVGADELEKLRHYGWSQEIPQLRKEIRAAVAKAPPSADVKATLLTLLDLAAGEAVVVTDGMSPDDESEDDIPEEIKHVFGKCVDTGTHKVVPCPTSGADDKHGKDRAAQIAHLEASVKKMGVTSEGKETLERGYKLAEKVKEGIGVAVKSAIQALDDESQGGASYLLASIRRLDAGGAQHGFNAVFRSVFTNVHEEIFELALAGHSVSGAHAIGSVGAKVAAVAETHLLRAVAWAWRKATTREALESLAEAGAELTDADRKFLAALGHIGAEAIRTVLRSAGVEDAEVDAAALARKIAASLRAA